VITRRATSSGHRRRRLKAPRRARRSGHRRRRLKAPRRARRSGHHRRRLKAPRRARRSGHHRRRLKAPRRARRSGHRHRLPPAKALLHARRKGRQTARRRASPTFNSAYGTPLGLDAPHNRTSQPMMAGLFGLPLH
jgi:hypothetical protein